MTPMVEKFASLWPEIAMLIGATVCLITGLAPSAAVRRATVWVAAATLVVAGLLVPVVGPAPSSLELGAMAQFVRLAVVGVGLVLLMVAAAVPGQLRQNREAEAGPTFEPGNVFRGEFFAFFLLSLTGVMLTAGADDLVWLFLALELTSLPTYVMVATARDDVEAQESAVKYFFLGAMSAAVFLYGFALIYGATGFTDFGSIAAIARDQLEVGVLSPLLITGLVLSVVGICFKIAAVPMHFYAADVYEGAATPVTAFLAFVPKTAGFVALILLLSLVDWHPLPGELMWLVWIIAAATMTVGNVLALLQDNVKRVLAYSSIAHSGYILVGLMAGPGLAVGAAAGVLGNGLAAVLFYLVAYGLGTIAAFAVLGCLHRRGLEAETFDDISGLVRRYPGLAGILLIAVLSLLGLPPLVGFLGKIYLFAPAYSNAGEAGVWLVIIAVLNSAISAAYYLRIASVAFFGRPADDVAPQQVPGRAVGAAIAAVAALILGVAGTRLIESAHDATVPPVVETVEAGDADAAPQAASLQ